MKSTRHNIKPKKKWDSKGISATGGLIVIIIIIGLVVLFWEIGLLFFGVSTVESKMFINNRITGEKTQVDELGVFLFEQEEGHVYNLRLETNAPFTLVGESYTLVYSSQNVDSGWSETPNAFARPIPINALWQNSFPIAINSSNLYNADIQFRIYDPNGVELNFWDFTLLHVTGLGNF